MPLSPQSSDPKAGAQRDQSPITTSLTHGDPEDQGREEARGTGGGQGDPSKRF